MRYPSFIDNNTFYHLDKSHDALEQVIALAENIKCIHQLNTKHYDNFEALIKDYLQSGITLFQMQTGIVSQITQEKKYIVKDVVTDLEVINQGDEYELEGTYCKEVYNSQKTLGFPCIKNIIELKDHPVYVNLKLEAYLSAPIFVNKKLYGTLNFTSLIPRENGFSKHEHDLISMMASAIGNFILLQEKEERLKHLNLRMKELVGHVSHDLRGPIGSINGLCKNILSHEWDTNKIKIIVDAMREESAKSLELVNVILDQSALSTGKINLQKTHFKAQAFFETALKSFDDFLNKKELHIQMNIAHNIELYADKPRLLQVVRNLLTNAIKYSKKGSQIHVKLSKDSTHICCMISNTKSEEEIQVDESIYKSVGYGLDIVTQILDLHQSKLNIQENKTSYRASFDLPCEK